jgi:hypothetical protein
MVTVDRDDGLSVESERSEVSPQEMCFLISGPTLAMVRDAIVEVLNRHPLAKFHDPLEAGDGGWTAFGRVPL